MIKLLATPVTALLVLLCVPALAGPPVELTNPGFEVAGENHGLPAGWHRYVAAFGQARLALDRQVKGAGEAALRVEIADQTRCAVSQLISVTQPGPYTFSCRVRMPKTPTAVAQLQIEWFQTVDWPRQIRLVASEAPSPALSDAAEWTELAATGSKPADADLALVAIIIGDGQTPAGTVWVDEARWRPGAFPAPLVANAGFEADAGKDGHPDGWGPAMYGGGFDLKRDDTVAHSGKASARLTGAKEHGDRSCYAQATPVFAPPSKVRLSFWYKGTGLSYLIMHLLTPAGVQKPGGGIEYGAITATPPLSDEWQQFSEEIAVPPEAKQAGIMRLDIILYQKGEGTLWYDDVKVELVE
jgi:hypothetical protein